jgi:hypothetical protein
MSQVTLQFTLPDNIQELAMATNGAMFFKYINYLYAYLCKDDPIYAQFILDTYKAHFPHGPELVHDNSN